MKIKKKSLIFILLLLLVVSVGSTYAVFYTQFAIPNKFDVMIYDVRVEDDFSGSWGPRSVKFTNNDVSNEGVEEGLKIVGIEQTSRDLAVQIINISVMIILFFGIKFALRFVQAIADAVAKLPILNKINKVGGIVYGLIRGLVIVYACLLLIGFAGKINDESFIHKSVEESTVGKTMYENNLLNFLL